MMSNLLITIAAIISSVGFVRSAVDNTLVVEANGSLVVQACIAKISQSDIFSVSDQQMLRRIAYVETRDGSDSSTYSSNSSHGGIWQVSEAKYLSTKNTGSNSQLQQQVQGISTYFGINWLTTQWSDLRKPFYSALAARLYFQVITASIPLASSLSSQGTYWASYFTSSGGTQSDFVNAVTQLQNIEECSVSSLDLFFVMDASGSVGYSNFQLMKSFVYDIADSFEVSSDKVRVGVMSYGSSNSFHFFLNTYSSKSSVLLAINNLPYSGGGTNTAGALDGARISGFSVSNGARPTSQGVPRVAVVITDGYSNSYSATVTAANSLHSAGIIAFAIGIAGANQNELNAIASQSDYVSFISSFNVAQLDALQISISQESCVVSPDLTLNQNVTDVIGSGETKYLNYPLPNNNMGITVTLNVTNGSAILYASTVVSTPNEAFHDVAIESNNFEDVYIDPANLTNAANADTVYIAIEGEGASNQIHVSATQGDTSTEPVMVGAFANNNISKNIGQSTTVTCRVTGKPQPVVHWQKDGLHINNTFNMNTEIQNSIIDNTTIESVLVITAISYDNEGVYTCKGMNVLPNGTVIQSQSFTLTVTGVIVSNFTGISISSTSIYLSWSLPQHAINFGVQYYLVDVDEQETSRSWTFHAVDQHANIISLHPYYTYYCRVAVVGNVTYQYSNTIILTTHQAAPSGAVQISMANILSSTMLNITWSPPPVDQQNGVIQHYIIVVTEVNTNLTIHYTTSVLWYYMNDLHPFYEYTISIAAVTIAHGPFNTEINFVMPEAAPSSAPINVSTSSIDSQSFRVSWQPPILSDQNGIIRKYSVVFLEVDTGMLYNQTTTNEYIVIVGVHPYFTYRIRVRAFTISPGPFSNETTIITPEDAPNGPPETFNATVISPYSAILTWDPPPFDKRNGLILGYVINMTVVETRENFILYSNTTSLSVNGLRPFRTYVCIIAAMTKSGIGPYSPVLSVSTPQDAPSSPPLQIQNTSVSSRSLSLTWNPPLYSDQNGVISHYVIYVMEVESSTVTQYTSYTATLSLSLLHPSYTYHFTIAAYTVALGPFSIQFNVTTLEEAPGQPPENLTGEVLSSSFVSLSWNPPPSASRNGLIISYSLNITSLESGSSVLYTSISTAIDIDGLYPYTTYTCIIAARTSVGLGPYTTAISFTTNEDAPIASPRITLLYAVDAQSVALQWSSPPIEYHNGLIRKYIVKLQVVGNNETVVYHNITSTTAIIGLLIPSYTYQFSVAAYTVALGPFTALSTLTLPEDAPSGYPQSLVLNHTTPYSVLLVWAPPSPDEQHGIITGYFINVTHSDTLNTIQYYTVQTSINITGLDPYTTYVCIVAAETSVGIGPFSHLFFVQTDEAAPDSPPQHPNAIALNSTSIHITWDPPLLQDHNGVIREYRINVTEKISGIITEHIENQTQLIVTGLKPFRVYFCSIVAVTVDEGPYTVSVSVLTKEDAPSSSPQSLSAIVTSPLSMIASWVAPPIGSRNGIVRQYIVIIHNALTGTDQTYIATSSMLNISTLNPYTNYSIEVAAFTVETGPFTTPYEITTWQDEPTSPPKLFNASITNSTNLILWWAPPDQEGINGIIQYYNITNYELDTNSIFYYTTSFLYFPLTYLHPFYTYKCTVAAVTIGAGPKASLIIQMPEDVPSSSPVNIIGTALSSSVVSLSWNELPSEDQNGQIRHYIINVTEINTGINFQQTSSSLEITLSDLHPYYNYSIIVAAYTIGTGPFSEPILVTTAQDVPSSSPVAIYSTYENASEITLKWLPPSVSQRNGVILGYNLTIQDVTSDTVITVLSSLTVITIRNLEPYTTYQCIVAAYTVSGLGPYSSALYVSTTEAAPSLPPEALTIIGISSYTATLSWQFPPIDSHNGIIRGFSVKVFDVRSNNETIIDVTGSTAILSDLHPYSHYEITVAAFTTERGPFSTVLAVTSLEAVPSGSPEDLSVMAIDSFSLSLSWSPPSADTVNGVIRNYIINVTVMETLEYHQYFSENTSYIITELHPYYTYIVYVAAITIGRGPFSPSSSIRTPQYAPSDTPVNVTSTALNSTAVQVTWNPPPYHSQNGIISSYSITILELISNFTLFFQLSQAHNTYIISGLHPYYEYRISVAAYTIAIGPSAITVVTTMQDVPSGPPQNLTLNVTTSTEALLQWKSPANNLTNGIIQYYQIELFEQDTRQFTRSTSESSELYLSNLHPYYTYECNIRAVTIGPGPPTSNAIFQMLEDVPSAPPNDVRVTEITPASALLFWNPPLVHFQNGILTDYIVELVQGNISVSFVTTHTNLTVSSLKAFTQYRYTVSARTRYGQGPSANYTLFQTEQNAPSSPPFNVSITALSSTSFTLQWQSPPNEYLNGELTGFIVFIVEVNTGINYTNTTSSQSITLNSLHPYYTYNVSVAAVTVSDGPQSHVLSIQTNQNAPSGSPISVEVYAVTSQSATVSWSPPLEDKVNGIVQYYAIRLYELDTSKYFNLSSSNLSLLLNDLHPYYIYQVQVAAVTVAVGPHSALTAFRTKQDIPSGIPQDLHVIAVNSTSLFVEWNAINSTMTNGQIVSYRIVVFEMNSNLTFGNWNVNNLNATLNDLHPYYLYKVCVAGSTIIGTGPFADSGALTYPAAPKSPPRNLSVTVINSSSVRIEWYPPPHDQLNGLISHYIIVLYNHQIGVPEYYNSTFRFLVLYHLHPFYMYNCSVSIFTVESGPIAMASFQTAEDIPTGQPMNITVITLNYSSLLLSWNPPPNSQQNGIIRHYTINIRHNTTGVINVFIAVNKTQLIINDLKPFNIYVIELAAFTIGTGPFTTPVIIQLPESVPSTSPNYFVAEVINNISNLHLSWVTPSPNTLNGILLGYQLQCTDQSDHILSATITGTSVLFQNAYGNSHYTCTICAYTSVGCGPNAITHISTYENSSVGPPHFLSTNSTSTTIHLVWEPPFDPDSLILSYIITYQLVSTSFSFKTPRPLVTVTNINETSYTLRSLVVSSMYEVIIYALTENTTGPPSEPMTIMTSTPDDASPQSLNCAATSSSSLFCSWSPPIVADYEVQNYILSYKLLDGFDFYPNYGTTLDELKLPSITTEYSINGLLPFGGYIVKVDANLYSAIGSGFSGELAILNPIDDLLGSVTTFNNTYSEAPSGKVENVTLIVTSPRSMTVSWRPPTRKNWRGLINSYRMTIIRNYPSGFSFSNIDQPLSNTVVILPEANNPDPGIATEPLQTETHLLEGLEESFQYTILISVANAAGSSVASDPLQQIMPQAAPSGPPVNITLTAATKTSVNISWQPLSPIDANGIITGYQVIFTRIEINEMTEYTIRQDQNHLYKNGLHAYEQVSIQVSATTVVGRGPYSVPIYFYTNEEKPGPPQSPIATLINDTSVLLTWNPPTFIKSDINIAYQLFYIGYTHSTAQHTDGPYDQNTSVPMAVISNLLPGYIYQFQVRASNRAGYSINATVILLIPASEMINTDPTTQNDATERLRQENIVTIAAPIASAVLVIVVCTLMTTCILLTIRKSKKRGKKSFYSEPVVTVNPLTSLPMNEIGPVVPLRSMQLKSQTEVIDNNYEELPFNEDMNMDDLPSDKSTDSKS